MSDFKQILAKNLVALRKAKKLTQSELAEELSYSDKTVSKWENGDAVPDVETLILIANFFSVSMDDLVSKPYQVLTNQSIKDNNYNKRNKSIITLLSVSLVWLTATILYVQTKIINNANVWTFFIWAIPISFIVLLVFNCIWGRRSWGFIIISLLIWTMLASIHIQFAKFGNGIWTIYFLGIPLQVAVILWSQLKRNKKNN